MVALGLAVSRLDDQVYSLEILPESVRRKQRFVQRTVFILKLPPELFDQLIPYLLPTRVAIQPDVINRP